MDTALTDSGSRQPTLLDEVGELLSAEQEIITHFLNTIQSRVQEGFLHRLTGGFFGGDKRAKRRSDIKFTAKQATAWLVDAFGENNLEWDSGHVPFVLRWMLQEHYIDLKEPDPDLQTIEPATEFIFSTPVQSRIRHLLAEHKTERIGAAMAAEGMSAKYPVLIVPGLGATALSVWASDYRHDWVGERIWLDFSKIGSQIKVPSLWSRETNTKENTTADYGMFVRHMLLADDGVSDPPGVRVRPMEGLEAVASLSPITRITEGITTIFAEIIRNLLEVGYDRRNIAAAPYDWRLPAGKLEERDGYFTILKSTAQNLYELNGKKRIVLLCHSNGYRMSHYFTHWVEAKEPGWCEKHIHGFLALAAPYLGAPKMARAIVTGDAFGLDIILKDKEQEAWGRHMAAYPSLLPLQAHRLPAPTLLLYTGARPPPTPRVEGEEEVNEEEASLDRTIYKPPRNHPWEKYQDDASGPPSAARVRSEDEYIEITPNILAATWLKNDSLCVPATPERDEEYIPVLDGWAREKFLKLIHYMDAPSQIIKTARNGYKSHAQLSEDGPYKSINYLFDNQSTVKSLGAQRQSKISVDGKRITTTFFLPHQYYLAEIIRISEAGNTLSKWIVLSKGETTVSTLKRSYRRETPLTAVQQCIHQDSTVRFGDYVSPPWQEFISRVIPNSFDHYDKYFCEDEFILGGQDPHGLHSELSPEDITKYPILNPPAGIKNMWCIYGTGVDTEISFYLARKSEDDSLCFHEAADTLSLQEGASNPIGLRVKDGRGFETDTTEQPSAGEGVRGCGDGTVPYASLSYCRTWQDKEGMNVDVTEVPSQEHTDMLKSEEVIFHVLQYVCTGQNEFCSSPSPNKQ